MALQCPWNSQWYVFAGCAVQCPLPFPCELACACAQAVPPAIVTALPPDDSSSDTAGFGEEASGSGDAAGDWDDWDAEEEEPNTAAAAGDGATVAPQGAPALTCCTPFLCLQLLMLLFGADPAIVEVAAFLRTTRQESAAAFQAAQLNASLEAALLPPYEFVLQKMLSAQDVIVLRWLCLQ